LARAGLEEARIKLQKDLTFPPCEEQPAFDYSEDLADLDGNPMGHYEVRVDMTWTDAPYGIAHITAVGRTGSRASPTAQHTIQAELDVLPTDRSNPANPNPNLFRWVRWAESQAF
ncbi:MAG: hypothetical protein AB1758_06370, partial [Candidatus Eremiobacterota bacterium]